MDYKKIMPAVALTLGVAASINAAQAADLFQMAEVSPHGLQIACKDAKGEFHCGAGHQCSEHKSGAEKTGKKDAKPKDAAVKADKKDEKAADSKCAAGACGSDKSDSDKSDKK